MAPGGVRPLLGRSTLTDAETKRVQPQVLPPRERLLVESSAGHGSNPGPRHLPAGAQS
jgi:hypothetical protein